MIPQYVGLRGICAMDRCSMIDIVEKRNEQMRKGRDPSICIGRRMDNNGLEEHRTGVRLRMWRMAAGPVLASSSVA